MGFEEDLRKKFSELESQYFGNRKRMCDKTGIDYHSLVNFQQGKSLNVSVAARAVDLLGAKLVWPGDKCSCGASPSARKAQTLLSIVDAMYQAGASLDAIEAAVSVQIKEVVSEIVGSKKRKPTMISKQLAA